MYRSVVQIVGCCVMAPVLAGLPLSVVRADDGSGTPAKENWVGFGGPGGTRVYADSKPPTEFDVKAGKGFHWVTPLPSWGHGSPVATRDRVFVVCEHGPKNDFPVLVCLNAEDGKILWQRELDHLDKLISDPKECDQIRQDWRDRMKFNRNMFAYMYELTAAKDQVEKDAVAAKYRALGFDVFGKRNVGGWFPQPVDKVGFEAREKRLMAKGLYIDGFLNGSCGLDCLGHAFATPITDGVRVYAVTSFGGFFCFDMTGNPIWKAAALATPTTQWTGTPEYCQFARSPILWNDLLIGDGGNRVRAFDRFTGALKWSDSISKRCGKNQTETIVSPVVMKVGGRDILWSAGCSAYLLPEGKLLKVEGWEKAGMQVLVKSDEPDVVFFSGSGDHAQWFAPGDRGEKGSNASPAAVRFSLETGSTVAATNSTSTNAVALVLKAKVLWDGMKVAEMMGVKYDGRSLGNGFAPCMAYHSGRLYGRGGVILDALSGKVVAGQIGNKNIKGGTPRTGTLLGIAGGHVYGLDGGATGKAATGLMEVFTEDGKLVSANTFPFPDFKGMEDLAIGAGLGDFDKNVTSFTRSIPWSHGAGFAFGPDCIYARSLAHLWCVGVKK